jgi:hypothetical protein
MTTLENAKMKSLKDKIASTETPVNEGITLNAENTVKTIKKVIKGIKRVIKKK